ncbi:flagellar hook-associated protein FlgL [Cytobacillus purgationiresistens]|uniref:Flagellar hook-associated protein 3 FlgL n=1 Tax=Cytobacillus purgationiresistens TaxID=863449 RepID=A0ABU0AE70_9BACI|nr:flagellar hook-associated protein FlgL [Cytobacillus purgationiresistens]MDQ0269092.1 flagellar hook-associated protein 3 FlgL [Cytobacillus purgationiresistens]
MRVTQSMISNNSLRHIQNSYQKLGKLEEQLITGKKVNRPSDDPVVAMKGMRYRSQVVEVEQFQRNLGEVYNWMDNTEAALDEVNTVMQRIRELTVKASTDSYDASQRNNIASEIKQLRTHLESIANTKVNNKYIFNGTDTSGKPVDLSKIDQSIDITTIDKNNAKDYILFSESGQQLLWDESAEAFKGKDGSSVGIPVTGDFVAKELGAVSVNTESVNIEVSKGINLEVNTKPQGVFSLDLFTDLGKLISALESPDTSGADLTNQIDVIDGHMNKVITETAEIGAKYNRVEMVENRLLSQEIIAKSTMSQNEDIDAEKVIIELTSQEALHRAALAVGARIIQPSLVDFLR